MKLNDYPKLMARYKFSKSDIEEIQNCRFGMLASSEPKRPVVVKMNYDVLLIAKRLADESPMTIEVDVPQYGRIVRVDHVQYEIRKLHNLAERLSIVKRVEREEDIQNIIGLYQAGECEVRYEGIRYYRTSKFEITS